MSVKAELPTVAPGAPLGGHFGALKALEGLRRHFWWPGIRGSGEGPP